MYDVRIMYIVIFLFKTSKWYYSFTAMEYGQYNMDAMTPDHVNNFWDTITPILQTKSLVGTYTRPNAGRVNNYIWAIPC